MQDSQIVAQFHVYPLRFHLDPSASPPSLDDELTFVARLVSSSLPEADLSETTRSSDLRRAITAVARVIACATRVTGTGDTGPQSKKGTHNPLPTRRRGSTRRRFGPCRERVARRHRMDRVRSAGSDRRQAMESKWSLSPRAVATFMMVAKLWLPSADSAL